MTQTPSGLRLIRCFMLPLTKIFAARIESGAADVGDGFLIELN